MPLFVENSLTTTDHTTDAEYTALLRRILETPNDDAPRLIKRKGNKHGS
jgi:hypothetical protein